MDVPDDVEMWDRQHIMALIRHKRWHDALDAMKLMVSEDYRAYPPRQCTTWFTYALAGRLLCYPDMFDYGMEKAAECEDFDLLRLGDAYREQLVELIRHGSTVDAWVDLAKARNYHACDAERMAWLDMLEGVILLQSNVPVAACEKHRDALHGFYSVSPLNDGLLLDNMLHWMLAHSSPGRRWNYRHLACRALLMGRRTRRKIALRVL